MYTAYIIYAFIYEFISQKPIAFCGIDNRESRENDTHYGSTVQIERLSRGRTEGIDPHNYPRNETSQNCIDSNTSLFVPTDHSATSYYVQ